MYTVLTKYVPLFAPVLNAVQIAAQYRPRSRGATQRARGVRHSLILGRGFARLYKLHRITAQEERVAS